MAPQPVALPEAQAREDAAGAWIVRPRISRNPRLRLFLLPSAGRGPSMFRLWSGGMDGAIDLCLVQLPGREARRDETPIVDVAQVCRAIGEAIREELDRPFALFGHSLGGLLAFELTRHLRASMNVVPRVLFIAAHRAPHLPSPRSRIAGLPDAEFLAALNARHGGVWAMPRAHMALMRLLLQAIRADYQMAESYQHAADTPLPCAISVFGGVDDEHVSAQELIAWRQHTSAMFTHRMLPGDHSFVETMRDRVMSLILADL